MNTVFLFLNLSAFRVPVERQVTDARINITFRWILNHHVRGGCGTDLPGVRIAMIPVSGVPEIITRTKPLSKSPSLFAPPRQLLSAQPGLTMSDSTINTVALVLVQNLITLINCA